MAVAVVLRADTSLTLESLREWSQKRSSHYKIPRHMIVGDQLPRNAIGKVTKPAVVRLFDSLAR